MEVLRFAEVCQAISGAARSLTLEVPSFRAPPHVAGTNRTLRRTDHGAIVAVVIRDRPDADVIRDLVEGTLAANEQGLGSSPTRQLLFEAAAHGYSDDVELRAALGLKARPEKAKVDPARPPCSDDLAAF